MSLTTTDCASIDWATAPIRDQACMSFQSPTVLTLGIRANPRQSMQGHDRHKLRSHWESVPIRAQACRTLTATNCLVTGNPRQSVPRPADLTAAHCVITGNRPRHQCMHMTPSWRTSLKACKSRRQENVEFGLEFFEKSANKESYTSFTSTARPPVVLPSVVGPIFEP